MKPSSVRAAAAGLLALVLLAGCGPSDADEAGSEASPRAAAIPAEAEIPDTLQAGRRAYDQRCASCHGPAGTGTRAGPPLVHSIYRPAHHADAAFLLAVRNGVRAHHWRFGDMPPLPGVAEAEVRQIVAWVRWLQRRAGIE
ncbi:MAG: cytochrome c [Gemmatimonadetes bacterium]|nr:MAG: cytochrome c [Gemmatimonadota bacterium]